jgi:hypothetical protein
MSTERRVGKRGGGRERRWWKRMHRRLMKSRR